MRPREGKESRRSPMGSPFERILGGDPYPPQALGEAHKAETAIAKPGLDS